MFSSAKNQVENRPQLAAEFIIDLETGIVGRPGDFHGEHSFNGMPNRWKAYEKHLIGQPATMKKKWQSR